VRGFAAKTSLLGLAIALAVGASAADAAGPCPNEAFRTGPSAQLPDCRAYELVTPVVVNGVPEAAMGFGPGEMNFTSPSAAPSGDSYLFKLLQASLRGTEGNGFANLYEAKRSATGWSSSLKSPTGAQASGLQMGGLSSDQRYQVFELEGSRGGSLVFCAECNPVYIGYPDGSFHLLGEGTVPTALDTDGLQNGLTDDPRPQPKWISAAGTHQIFLSAVQLVANAAPTGTFSIYDRTASGLKTVSLLPGELTPTSGATFRGASADGSTVLFQVENDLYARVDDAETLLVASGSPGAALAGGVNATGSRIFYVQEGDIFAYDVAAESASLVAAPGDATLANVSADGSHAYFVSETELVSGKGTPGSPNLYAWDGSSIQFIATLAAGDLSHDFGNPGESPRGLALWTEGLIQRAAAENASRLLDTARTTPDGSVFVFESKAQLTPYPNEGHIEIYRYDAVSEGLTCVSCSPDQPAAGADAELAFLGETGKAPYLSLSSMLEVANLSADGQQVVFQTNDSLLAQDVNGVSDVYEWRGGQLSLVSTGGAAQPTLLVGIAPDGRNIFIRTDEKLVPQGQESGALAIYDARVDGGLASQQGEQPAACAGEGCQGQPSTPPTLPAAGSATFNGRGNVRAHRHHKRSKPHRHKHKRNKHRQGAHGQRSAEAGGRLGR
jgi:hypothetical protein